MKRVTTTSPGTPRLLDGAEPTPSSTLTFESDLDAFGAFLQMTAYALEHAVSAVLTDDHQQARVVRRSTQPRREAHDAAEDHIRRTARAQAGGSLAHALAALQCLDDVSRVGELAEQLARRVTRTGEHAPLAGAQRDAVEAISEAAVHRLRCLAEGVYAPTLDPDYLRCGYDLRQELARLPGDDEQDGPVTACAEVARAVLAASRHASRAA